MTTPADTKRLTLLRHAKSSWRDPELADFDRPLNKRGRHAAPLMAKRLAKRGFRPDLLLASPALRARRTVEAVAEELAVDADRLRFDGDLYLAELPQILALLQQLTEDHHNVLLVGHNPGLTDLINYLLGWQLENLPTCGVCSVELQIPRWQSLTRGCGRPLFYDYPKKGSE